MIKKVALNMDEQKKYEIIKRLVEDVGNKDRVTILDLYRNKYYSANFPRFSELLEDKQKATLSKKAADILFANLFAIEDAHSRRPRCAYFGELLQMDVTT